MHLWPCASPQECADEAQGWRLLGPTRHESGGQPRPSVEQDVLHGQEISSRGPLARELWDFSWTMRRKIFVVRSASFRMRRVQPVIWAKAEGDLKKLQAMPLGRYAGRAISSCKAIPFVDHCGRAAHNDEHPRGGQRYPALGQATGGILPPHGFFRKPLVGVAAVDVLFQKIEGKGEAKERLHYGDVQDLAIFNLLLTVEQRKRRDELTEHVLTRKSVASSSSLAPSGASSSTTDATDKEVATYFKKRVHLLCMRPSEGEC